MCEFIAEYKDRFSIAAICRALTSRGIEIAPRTYRAWAVRAPSKRSLWDTTVTEILSGYYEPDETGRRAAGIVVRGEQDVGAPAATRHPRGPLHGGTVDAGQRVAGCGAAHEGPHHRTRSGRGTGTGPGRAQVRRRGAERAARG